MDQTVFISCSIRNYSIAKFLHSALSLEHIPSGIGIRKNALADASFSSSFEAVKTVKILIIVSSPDETDSQSILWEAEAANISGILIFPLRVNSIDQELSSDSAKEPALLAVQDKSNVQQLVHTIKSILPSLSLRSDIPLTEKENEADIDHSSTLSHSDKQVFSPPLRVKSKRSLSRIVLLGIGFILLTLVILLSGIKAYTHSITDHFTNTSVPENQLQNTTDQDAKMDSRFSGVIPSANAPSEAATSQLIIYTYQDDPHIGALEQLLKDKYSDASYEIRKTDSYETTSAECDIDVVSLIDDTINKYGRYFADLSEVTSLFLINNPYLRIKYYQNIPCVIPCSTAWGFVINSESDDLDLCKQLLNDLYHSNSDFYNSINADTNSFFSEEASASPDLYVSGNTSGNIANYALVAAKDDWIFYTDQYDFDLYRMHKDGSEKSKVVDTCGSFMTISGDWLFYLSGLKDVTLCKYNINTSQNIPIGNKINGLYLNVIDDWIYFIDGESSDICKVQTDGTKLADLGLYANELYVTDKWIYYTQSDGIFKMKLDGTEQTTITRDSATCMNVLDDWVYYIETSGDYSYVNKIKIDGTCKFRLLYDSVERINVTSEWLYYIDVKDGYSLNRVSIDGITKEKINSKVNHGIYIVDNNALDLYDWVSLISTGEAEGDEDESK